MSEKEEDLEEAIQDGSYYAAARLWYSEIFHSPIAERNYYSIILVLAVIICVFACNALISVFPLKPTVPVVIYTDDVWEEVPRIIKLSTSSSEDRNIAVMRYMLGSYVINRESYDLKSYEMRYRNIWSESSSDVFDAYRTAVDAANPASPYRQFADVAKRDIEIISITYDPQMSHATVVFTELILSVADNREIRRTKWQADIAYQYVNFSVDQKLKTKNLTTAFLGLTENSDKDSGEETGVTPMKFVVTDYQLKELLE